MMTFVFRVLTAAAFNAERTWRSRQIRTLKKLGWSCEGRRGLDKDAVAQNSAPTIKALFQSWWASDMIANLFDNRNHDLPARASSKAGQRSALFGSLQ